MKTKKEIAQLIKDGKVENLKKYVIFYNQKQLIDGLYLLFKNGGKSYNITFESLPYSRGGKYARHTSTLSSHQEWHIEEYEGKYYISYSSTSKSAACPPVKIPIFQSKESREKMQKLNEKKAIELQKIAEKKAIELQKIADAKKLAKKQEAQKEADRLKKIASENGFKSVAEMKRAQNEIISFNNKRLDRAFNELIYRFEKETGEKYECWKIQDRIKFARMELIFDCEKKELIF